MKKLLILPLIILALLVVVPSIAPHAYANATDTNLSNDQLDGKGKILGTDGAASLSANQEAAAKTPTDLKQNPDDSYNFIMQKIMTLFAWLVGVAALTLDYAVYYTVVVMGNYIKGLTAVGISWGILRDIGNIMLIFGFLAVGISIILNTERLGYGNKMLPMLLVAAVFMNFSLFFTEAIIDTGNLFATQFFKQINGGNLPTALSLASLSTSNEMISTKLMDQLGFTTIYGKASNPNKAKEIFAGANSWFIGFMGILLFIVTAFVLFSLAFILIARFVILIFLIIISPLGFAGLAIPQLASTAKKWWSMLFQQTITAPVLLLMLYIALRVITDVQFLTGFDAGKNADWFGTTNSNLSGFGAIFLTFLVAMGLLIYVTILAKNLSAFGADWATKTAGALSFGATAWGLRSTVGWGSHAASQAIRRKYGGTKTGRLLSGALDKGAKASFDIRGSKIGGGLKGLGFDAGVAAEGGYRARLEKSVKGHEEYIKSVNKAIEDKGPSKEREEAANEAWNAKRAAAAAQELAQEAHGREEQRLKPQMEPLQAEVARLTTIVNEARNRNRPNIQAQNDLRAAEARLAAISAPLEPLKAALKQANKDFTDAVNAEEKAVKAADKEILEAKEKAQLAYAKNIQGSFFGNSLPGWVAYGPGGATAAKKIIKDAKGKTDDQKLLEAIKKAAKEVPPEAPPAAPGAGAPAPAAGGGGAAHP